MGLWSSLDGPGPLCTTHVEAGQRIHSNNLVHVNPACLTVLGAGRPRASLCRSSIDAIYKQLTRSPVHPLGGTAYLALEVDDEPYNGGVKYTAMPPTKRFRDMEQLSGARGGQAGVAGKREDVWGGWIVPPGRVEADRTCLPVGGPIAKACPGAGLGGVAAWVT